MEKKLLQEMRFMMERIESPRMTDTEYQKRRKLMKESSEEQEVAKEVEKVTKSSEFDAAMEKIWSKMSDQEKENVAKKLKQHGVIGELEEDLGSDGVDYNKAMELGRDLVENINEVGPGIVRTPADDTIEAIKKKVGKGLAGLGWLSTVASFGALIPTILGATGVLSLGAATAAWIPSLILGEVIWWLGNKIAGEKIDFGHSGLS
jgi:hypothetical protein